MDFEVQRMPEDEFARLLPFPALDAHKYSRGKAVIVGGSEAYPGAACLAAYASQRMGAGYTEVRCASGSVAVVRKFRPSLVVRSWDDIAEGELAPSRPGKPVAYVVGCGLDASSVEGGQEALGLLRAVLRAKAPVLVDGGGIAALGDEGCRAAFARHAQEGAPCVVTPHAGEAARLEGQLGIAAENADPAERARRLARELQAVVLLKGPDTYASDGRETFLVDEGTPALAKAGTGDVLSGMVGALLAQGMPSLEAAVLGATLHARAGRVAQERLTSICVTAEDVVGALPEAIKRTMLVAGRSPRGAARRSEAASDLALSREQELV